MTTDVDKIIDFILEKEGGFVDDPADPGGRTNMGITQATYDRYSIIPGDVANITLDDARRIYRKGYWYPSYSDQCPLPVNVIQFDTAVQRGPKRAVEMLQRVVEAKPDGYWGPKTEHAVWSHDPRITATRYLDARERHYFDRVKEKPSQEKFLKGWYNRLDSLAEFCGLEWKAKRLWPT